MSLFRTAVVAAMLCLGLTGCFRATPVVATPDYETAARNFVMPPADRARLYIVSGTEPSGSLLGPSRRLHYYSTDIYVDGVKIGSLNPKEIMVFDVVPGKHVTYYEFLNKTDGSSERTELDSQGGSIQMLATNIGSNLQMTKGHVYSAGGRGPTTSTVPAMFTIVRPSSCPPTICP